MDGVGGGVAVPVNGIDVVPPAALCPIVNDADFAPVVAGRNVRSARHAAPGTSVRPALHVDVPSRRNSVALVPTTPTLDKLRFADPVFETVTAAIALALPA